MSTKKEKQLADDLSLYIKELARMKYESEIRREDSLIMQASQMQTAFSFSSAALFMVAAIAVEYKEPWTFEFLLLIFSTITGALLVSLVLATIAQRRVEREDFPHIEQIKEFICENYEDSETIAKRNIQWVDMIGKIEKDLSRTNDNKVVLIQWSMYFFYIAISLSVFWFVMAVSYTHLTLPTTG